ncbi:MAG: hypothetical protein KDA97_08800 [Acidimicrobiales bacterium]|nr:hypothetical protein [Acidimicrobiales bacterium]
MEAPEEPSDEVRPVSRRRLVVVTALVVGWLAIQLAVPLVRLVERGGAPRPRTFGWQMFSHQLEAPAERYYVATRNGRREVDIRPYLSGPMRREILYGPALVAELCSRPEVIIVEVVDVEWGTAETRCR